MNPSGSRKRSKKKKTHWTKTAQIILPAMILSTNTTLTKPIHPSIHPPSYLSLTHSPPPPSHPSKPPLTISQHPSIYQIPSFLPYERKISSSLTTPSSLIPYPSSLIPYSLFLSPLPFPTPTPTPTRTPTRTPTPTPTPTPTSSPREPCFTST